MKPMLQYTASRLDDYPASVFNGWPVLWSGDRLSDTPPPVVPPDGCSIAGHGMRHVQDEEPTVFVVLRGIAGCEHEVIRRVGFFENIKTFEHYGTVFEGSSYSIKNAAERMAGAMQTDCPLCSVVRHSLWIWVERLEDERRSAQKHLFNLKSTLDANFTNWRDILPESDLDMQMTEANDRRKAAWH